jgi:PAS domain S-box-containing protein
VEVQTQTGVWYMMRILPYRTLDNVIEGAVITFDDIMEIKRAETAIRRSETLLRSTEKLARVGGWEWDVEKQTLFWTEELYNLHGFEPGEFVPQVKEHIARSLECYQPEDRPLVLTAGQRCVEEGQPYDLEFRFTTAKGRELWIRTFAEPVLEDGRVVRAVGCIMDITERKRAEEVLQKSLSDVRTLRGIVPICANCKKIRDDQGYWNQVEAYVSNHTEAQFSHGICPECREKMYPTLGKNKGAAPENGGAPQ